MRPSGNRDPGLLDARRALAGCRPGRETGLVAIRHDGPPEPGEGARRPERWLVFRRPRLVVAARRVDQVAAALLEVEAAVAGGLVAAGFVCYEAAPAFDPAFRARRPGPLPLLWFGLYERAMVWRGPLPTAGGPYSCGPWRPTVGAGAHAAAVARVRDLIAAGQTYQVNLTHRLRSAWSGDPWTLMRDLQAAQRGRHGAYVHTGRHVICSASPELAFTLAGGRAVTRPMKGTAPRGRWPAEDSAAAAALQMSAKERAENIMIVDMARNDLGRVAPFGAVSVSELCALERYPTVWQMVSTVAAATPAGPRELLAALFPCASITGAPKARTTEIIAALETTPRGIYTGCIGFWAPGAEAAFNVAIRTVWIDLRTGRAEYGTGGGITWDSRPAAELAECAWKAAVLAAPAASPSLLETLAWRPRGGYFLRERHLERLVASAAYFDLPLDPAAARRLLRERAARWRASAAPRGRMVRLRLDAGGALTVTSRPLPAAPRRPWRVGLARAPVDERDLRLFHKTTRRDVYAAARAGRRDCDEVLLLNTRGELTEATTANLVLDLDGGLWTPPVGCGLLPGTLRAALLARGVLRERVLRPADLGRARAIWLINSVRGWIPARPVDGPAPIPRRASSQRPRTR